MVASSISQEAHTGIPNDRAKGLSGARGLDYELEDGHHIEPLGCPGALRHVLQLFANFVVSSPPPAPDQFCF